jgi:hypothetical protein
LRGKGAPAVAAHDLTRWLLILGKESWQVSSESHGRLQHAVPEETCEQRKRGGGRS